MKENPTMDFERLETELRQRAFDIVRERASESKDGEEEKDYLRAVLSTDSAVPMPDFERMEMVPEVLASSGFRAPRGARLPLIDSHDRSSISKVLGSVRSIQAEDGRVVGDLYFNKSYRGKSARESVDDGDVNGVSVGYSILEKSFVPKGKTRAIEGRQYTGPINVVTAWEAREVSLVVVPADENARVMSRAKQTLEKYFGASASEAHHEGESAMADKSPQEEARSAPAPAEVPTEHTRGSEDVKTASVTAATPTGPTPEEVLQSERSRVSEINRLGRQLGNRELADSLIEGNVSIAEAKDRFLSELSKRSAPVEQRPAATGGEHAMRKALRSVGGLSLLRGTLGDQPHITASAKALGHEEREAFNDLSGRLSSPSVLLRHIIAASDDPRLASEAFGWGTRECADYLFDNRRSFGGSIRGGRVNTRSEGVGMVAAEFSNILLDAMHKEIVGRMDAPDANWDQVATVDPLSDFRDKHLLTSAEPPRLRQRNERESVEYENFLDAQRETYSLAKYRGAVSLSYEMIVNDDLGEFMNFVSEMAAWIPVQVNESFWRHVKDNPALADGSNLFDATVGNYQESADYDMAADKVKAIKKALTSWKTRKGRRDKDKETGTARLVNVQPAFLIVPPTLEFEALELVNMATQPGQTNPALANFAQFSRLQVLVVPEFEHPGNSPKAKEWYLFAGRERRYARVGFLNGNRTPDVTTEPNNQTDAIDYFWRLSWAPKVHNRLYVWKTKGEA